MDNLKDLIHTLEEIATATAAAPAAALQTFAALQQEVALWRARAEHAERRLRELVCTPPIR